MAFISFHLNVFGKTDGKHTHFRDFLMQGLGKPTQLGHQMRGAGEDYYFSLRKLFAWQGCQDF